MADIRIIPSDGLVNVTGSINFKGTGGSTMLFMTGSSGNVGIGTTSPSTTLDILGKIKLGLDGTYGGSDYVTIGFGGTSNGYNRVFGYNGTADGLYLTSATGRGIIFRTNGGSSDTVVINASGNLGVGTSPNSTFQVSKGGVTFQVTDTNKTANNTFSVYGLSQTSWAIATGNSGSFSGGEKVVILDSGNIGIGITTPGATLVVGTQSSGQSGTGVAGDNSLVARFGASNAAARVTGVTVANTATATIGNNATLSFVVAGNYSATGLISSILQNTSTAATDMAFSVYNSSMQERMRLTAGGSLGIGTSVPDSLLHIYGSGNTFARYRNTTNTGHYVDMGANSAGESFVYSYGAYPLLIGTNGATRMTVLSGGNVGIGTTNPTYKLDVESSVNGELKAASFVNSNTGTSAYSEINVVANDATLRLGVTNTNYSGQWTGGGVFFLAPGGMFFGPGNDYKVSMLANGNVGIGSTVPTNKLQVAGGVTATSFVGPLTGNASTATSATTAATASTFNGLNFNGITTRFTGDLNTLGLSSTSGIYNIGAGYTNGPGANLYGTLFGIWNTDISVQFWATYNGDFYWRKSVGPTYSGGWRTILDTVNYNSYTPTLTGTGASGTWAIAISGNAATATSASYASTAPYSGLTGTVPTWNQNTTGTADYANYLYRRDIRAIAPNDETSGTARFGFTSWANNNTSPWADFLHLRSYTDASGGSDNLVMFKKDGIGMRIWQQSWNSSTDYSSYKDVAFTDSNITGNAATATTASFATTAATAASATNATNATNATYINVTEKNDNVNYQVLFSTANGTGNQAIYIDTDDAHLTYNPSSRTLSSATFVGNLTGNADTATSATSAGSATSATTAATASSANDFYVRGTIGVGTISPPGILSVTSTSAATAGKAIFNLRSNSYGQIQLGNTGGGEASMAFIGNASAFSTDPTSADGNGGVWVVGASIWGGGSTSFGIGNKGYFTANGSTGRILTILSGGNIGMQTTSPTAPLHINAAGGNGLPSLRITSTASDVFNWPSSAEYPNLATGETVIHLFGKANSTNNQAYVGYRHVSDGSTGNMLSMGLYGQDYLVNITAAGNMGIGTTSPAAKLDIQGQVRVNTTTAMPVNASMIIGGVQNAGSSAALQVGGFVRIGTELLLHQSSANSARVSYDTNGLHIQGGYEGTAYNNVLIAESGGNVGIGTTGPIAKLHVSGTAGALAFNVEGSQGQLFSVTDSLSGSLMSVNDISGLPILEVFSDDRVIAGTFGSNALVVTGSSVGIGAYTPARKLDVYDATAQIVAQFSSSNATSTRIKFTDANTGAENVNIGAIGTRMAMWTNNTERVSILSGGNVGIGTTNPSYKLHVAGTSWFEAEQSISYTNSIQSMYGGSGYSLFRMYGASNAVEMQIDSNSHNASAATIGTYSNHDVFIKTNQTNKMVVKAGGNVGINTSSPTHKLHVNGTLRVDNASAFDTRYQPTVAFPDARVWSNIADDQVLGTPDNWLAINVGGTNYVIPLYAP